jgi:hypothetical protein
VLLPSHDNSPEIKALRERLAALQDFEWVEFEALDASFAQAAQLHPLRTQLELQAALEQTQADFIAYLTEQGE